MAGRLARVGGLAFAGIALVLLVGLPFPAVINPALRVVVLASLAALGAAGLVVAIVHPRHGWYLAGAGALIAATCVSVLTSRIPSAAGQAVLLNASLAGIGLVALEWTRTPRGRTDAIVLVGLAVTALVAGSYLAACLAVFLEWMSLGMPPTAFPLRPAGVGGLVPGPIWTTDYLVLAAPIGVALLWRFGGTGRVAAVVLGAAATAAVLLAAVRAVWVAVALILLVLALLWIRSRDWPTRRKAMAAAAIGGVVVVGGLVAVTRFDTLLRSIDEGRSTAIAAAVAIGARDPLTGAGPGTYGSLRLGEPAEAATHLALPDAHNLFAQVFAELGVLGLVALGAAAVAVGWVAVRRRPAGEGIAIAAIVGLSAVLAHRMADMVFVIPGIAVCALVIGAIAVGARDGEPLRNEAADEGGSRMGRIAQRIVAAGILAALVLSIPPTVTRLTAESAYREAAAALERGDVAGAVNRADGALAAAPDLAPALVVRSVARATAGDMDAAIDDARRALELEPMSHARLRLAVLLDAAGRSDAALALYREILAMRPAEVAPLLNAASAFTDAGAVDEARETARRLLALEPGIVRIADDLPPAVADLVRDETRTALAGRTTGSLSLGAIQAVAWLDGLDAATALAAEPGVDPALATIAAALDGTDASWSRLDALAKNSPTLAPAAWWVAAETCRARDLARWSRVVEIQTGTAPVLPISAGTVPEASGDLEPTRYPDWLWGIPSPRTPYPPGTWLVQEAGLGRCPTR